MGEPSYNHDLPLPIQLPIQLNGGHPLNVGEQYDKNELENVQSAIEPALYPTKFEC